MQKRFNRGNSLIEVLVTISVVSIGLIILYSLFVIGIRFSARSKHLTIATQLLSKNLEETRSTPFATFIEGSTTHSISELPSGQIVKNISAFETDTNVKQITLEIHWRERQLNQSVSAVTLVTNGGIGE